MNIDGAAFLALVNFAFVTSITPGPNNLMLLASGAAFGWRKTVPHMIGIAVGFSSMIGSVVLGLGAVLQDHPEILSVLRFVGATWLLWLAWKIAKPALGQGDRSEDRQDPIVASNPLRLYEAALFQWVNPKAWIMAVGASTTYASVADGPVQRALVLTIVFIVAALVCNTAWTVAGQSLQRLTMEGNGSRVFSLAMGVLVALSAVLVLIG